MTIANGIIVLEASFTKLLCLLYGLRYLSLVFVRFEVNQARAENQRVVCAKIEDCKKQVAMENA
jgi:hypothetical protein